MDRSNRTSKAKKINPHFWVFCEGETEEAYVKHLRTQYRIPIEIVPKIVGNKITERFIKSYKKGKPVHSKDKDFLLYDADVKAVLEKLLKFKSAILIASNPSIELWFLLHYKIQKGLITTVECIRELSNRNRNEYKKGLIDDCLKTKLTEKRNDAYKRAKATKHFKNPSTNVHLLIDELNEAKKK
jgi:RloB-like protein